MGKKGIYKEAEEREKMRKTNMIELIQVASLLLFVIMISIYHISYDGYLGISESNWAVVWSVGENGLLLTLAVIVSYIASGALKLICRWILIPYFVLKFVYHISCFSGKFLLPVKTWNEIWSYIFVGLVITTFITCLHLIQTLNDMD